MLPFSLAAGLSCPTHADLAASLAAEFRLVDEHAVDAALDCLAAELGGARHLPERDQLDALAGVMAAYEPVEAPLDASALLIDVALDRFSGHPAILTVIAVEAARRAGLALGVVGEGRRHRVGPYARCGALALDPGGPALTRLGSDRVGWRCAHQVAFALLREYVDRALRAGDIAGALRAAELRLELPMEDWAIDRLRDELQRLRARLN